jgi:hypothetical protein
VGSGEETPGEARGEPGAGSFGPGEQVFPETRHCGVGAVAQGPRDEAQEAGEERPAPSEAGEGVKDRVAPRQEPPILRQDDDGPARSGRFESGDASRGGLSPERREAEQATVPVLSREKSDAPMAEPAGAVVEDEVRHGGSVRQVGRNGVRGGAATRPGAGMTLVIPKRVWTPVPA